MKTADLNQPSADYAVIKTKTCQGMSSEHHILKNAGLWFESNFRWGWKKKSRWSWSPKVWPKNSTTWSDFPFICEKLAVIHVSPGIYSLFLEFIKTGPGVMCVCTTRKNKYVWVQISEHSVALSPFFSFPLFWVLLGK